VFFFTVRRFASCCAKGDRSPQTWPGNYHAEMSELEPSFSTRYGHWAVVAGASEGLGEAFAEGLAQRGLNLILLARRADVLDALATRLRLTFNVEVVALACDLADRMFTEELEVETKDRDIGVIVYNAAFSYLDPLLDRPIDDSLLVTDVNIRAPLCFIHALAPAMVERKRGAIVIMSSLAGFTGSPKLAVYSASKSFLTTLGEALWAELKPSGVDVLVSCAGAIRTPNYLKLRSGKKDAPGTLEAADVVKLTLEALQKGPMFIPGRTNKLAYALLRRIVPRRVAIAIMAKSVEKGA
jgi:uncharacterized protein